MQLLKYYVEIKEILLNTNKIPKESVQQLLHENKRILVVDFEKGKTPKEIADKFARYFNFYMEIKESLLKTTQISEEIILQLAKKNKIKFINNIEKGKTAQEIMRDLWLIERIGE